MRESSIIVPNSYFIRKYDWALKATEGNQPAAELIAVFNYHFDNPTANRILVELVRKAIAKHGLMKLQDLDGFQPYSLAYLRELLLHTHGQHQIIEALKVLYRIKFIDTAPDEFIPAFYSKTHTWVRLEIPNINDWIETVWIPAQKQTIYAPRALDVKEAIENVTGAVVEKMVEDEKLKPTKIKNKWHQVQLLCAFDKHIHGRTANYVYDDIRQKQILARLKENYSMSECAQGIIGLIFSDWHNARHPENMEGVIYPRGVGKKYLDVEYIFKSRSKHLEKRMREASENGVTVEVAGRELALFQEGRDSNYAAKFRKVKKKEKEKSEIFVTPENRSRYKAFAFSISRFFVTGVPSSDVLEMCQTNTTLEKQGKGLVDVDVLTQFIVESVRTAKPSVPEEMMENIKTFANLFCELQEFNG